MLNVNSSGDGYSGNWVRICDTCKAAASTLYCPTDLAYLCNSCDERIHAANSMALPHEQVWIFTACENETAAFTSKIDAASLCMSCDADTNLADTLAHNHVQVPAPPFPSLVYAPSSTYLEEMLDTKLDVENEITAPTTDEVDQDETDSWLLLEPDNNDNQTNSGFTFGEELDESFGIVEYNSCTEYQHQDQNNQQQLYSAHHGDNASDGIVPVQCSEVNEQEERQQQQHQHQQLQNVYFNRAYEASKAAFINTPSSSQIVPMSGILPKATVSKSSYTRYPQGTTNIYPNFSLLMPLQFTSVNREAKVLRYKEKRKSRKFEKKVRYASRKAYAEARPRVKGRFARKTEMDYEVDEMFSTEDCDYGIVPSY